MSGTPAEGAALGFLEPQLRRSPIAVSAGGVQSRISPLLL